MDVEASYLRQWKDITARGDQGLVSLLASCSSRIAPSYWATPRVPTPTPVDFGAAAQLICRPTANAACFVAHAPASAITQKNPGMSFLHRGYRCSLQIHRTSASG